MHHSFTRLTSAAALVAMLGVGTATAFAANGSGSTSTPLEVTNTETDAPDTLPKGAISLSVAQQDALKNYPGGTAVSDGVNDQNGTITYGFTVTANGKTYDVQVDARNGTVVQTDAGDNDGTETGGEDRETETGTTERPDTGADTGADLP